jgi:electron transport complex protein RnfG
MVGFLPDGTIHGIEVIAHKETPGLGDKMESGKSDFSVQFKGKNPENFKLAVVKDGGNVDAITASTISSRAYCDAVKRAYDAFIKEGGEK